MRKLLIVLAVAGAAVALVAWPRISDVETGRTPEYPDLQPRVYSASEAEVVRAARDVIGRLPGWSPLATGSGAAGSAVTARHRLLPLLPLEEHVTVKARRAGGRTSVSVRSRSRWGPLDFGQNARNIRALVAELDRELR